MSSVMFIPLNRSLIVYFINLYVRMTYSYLGISSSAVTQQRSDAVTQWRSDAVTPWLDIGTFDQENPGSDPVLPYKTMDILFNSTLLQFVQLYEWVP